MAVAFGSLGATSTGTTSLSTNLPSGVSSTDLLLYFAASKLNDSSHSTPSGYSLLDAESAGSGSESGDNGTVVASLWSRIADGSESGAVGVTVTNGNVAQGVIARITRSGGSAFDVATTTARVTTTEENPLNVVFDDTLDIQAGDYLAVFWGVNTDRMSGVTSPSFSATGLTFGTPTVQRYSETSTGNDMGLCMVDVLVDTGTATSPVTFGLSKTGSADGEGPLILVRVREVSGGGAQTVAIGQATETDTAQAFTATTALAAAIGQASETDTAQALTPVTGGGAQAIGIGQAQETDTAQALTVVATRTVVIGQAQETDTAQALTVVATRTAAIGQAEETDEAQAMSPVVGGATLVGQASETDAAQPLTAVPGVRTVAIGQAAEVDSAQAMSARAAATILAGMALEIDTAQPLASVTGSALVTIGQALEVNLALALSVGGTAAPVVEAAARMMVPMDDLRMMVPMDEPLPRVQRP